MNKKGMELFAAMDGVSDEMMIDALPPGMGMYKEKRKNRRLSEFFERPWVAAVISAAVALAVLGGIIWAGNNPAESPGEVAGNPSDSLNGENMYPSESDKWPDYDNPPVPEDAKLVISSGGYTIAAEEYIQWQFVWNAEAGKMEEVRGSEQWYRYLEEVDSGADISERMNLMQSLPCVPYEKSSFQMSVREIPLELQYAVAYREYSDSYSFAYGVSLDMGTNTVNDLMDSLTESGRYYILVVGYDRGTYNENAGENEDTMYEFLFAVDVFGAGKTESPDEPPMDMPEGQTAMGVEVWAGYSNATYELLPPAVLKAHLYDDEQGVWQDVSGEYWVTKFEMGEVTAVPALTYAEGFSVFFKPIDKTAGEASFNGMVIYDEHLDKQISYQDVAEDFYQLATLTPGTYYVGLTVDHTGRVVDGELEWGLYDYFIKLTVPDAWDIPDGPDKDFGYDSVSVISGNQEIHPAYRNEWPEEALIANLNALPALHHEDCFLNSSDGSTFKMSYFRVYTVEGEVLTLVESSSDSNLFGLRNLADGYYCVVFTVEYPADPEDTADMRSREYAFMLYKGYTYDEGGDDFGEEGTTEPDTVRPTDHS